MAAKKDLSIEEIMALARGGKPATPSAEKASAPEGEKAPAESAPAKPKPPAASGKPAAKGGGDMSLDAILSAARAGKAGGESKAEAPAKKPPVAKPAAEKPAAEKPAKPAKTESPKSESPPLDTSSILAAARGARPGPMSKAEAAAKEKSAPDAGKKKIAVPPMPEKPAYALAAAPAPSDGESRRGFFGAFAAVLAGSYMAVGFSSLAITNLLWTLGLARFMFPNVLTEPPMRFKIDDPPDSFSPGQVKTFPQFGIWVVRHEYEGQTMIYALKMVCTHLGCTPSWLEAEQKFKCPCHGSGFYKDGVNFEGPAPRPLERYAVRRAEDGKLEIDKSRLFLEEKGGWKDPASYVTV